MMILSSAGPLLMTNKYKEANEFAEHSTLPLGIKNFIAEVCIIGADRHWGFDLADVTFPPFSFTLNPNSTDDS